MSRKNEDTPPVCKKEPLLAPRTSAQEMWCEASSGGDFIEGIQVVRRAEQGPTAPRLRRVSRSRALSLSFAQQRLWLLDQWEPGSAAYNLPAAYRLTGALDLRALEQSFTEIVRRHEVLRTTFVMGEGRPVQIIAPARTIELPVIDLCDIPAPEREAQVLRRATAEAQRPFDLARGPLVRISLLRLGAEEHVLLLVMHQIVSDDWSLGVLFHELAVLYEAFAGGQPAALPELSIQYADFAHWQRQWLQGAVLEQQLTYWKQRLGNSPPVLELPTDRARPARQTYRGTSQSLRLPSTLSEALKALSRQEGVTLFMTLLAAFQVLLARYTGQEDILVGSPIANRTRAEIKGLIGFFVNRLVLRTDLSGNPSFRELLQRVREVCLEAYVHPDLPFERLVEELQPERDPSHSPLFQVFFTLLNFTDDRPALSTLILSPVEVGSETATFDLTLSIVERADSLTATLNYNTDLFDTPTIARMLGHLQTLLVGAVANPGQSILTLPLLTQAERHQLLVEWNKNQSEYPQECIHEVFEAQVDRTPENVAVVFADEQLTYRELNCRANQLAHRLRALGVGPEVLVGISMEYCPELVIGILGILKAGGACVPLDPTYPPERLAFLLADTRVPVLLTQRRLLGKLPKHSACVVCIDVGAEIFAQESTEPLVSGVTNENLAFVFYTSGSTGAPKGVMLPHRGRYTRQSSTQPVYQLTPDDQHLLKAPIGFSLLLREVLWPLLAGARLIIAQPGERQDSAYLVKLIADHKIAIIHLVPSQLHMLLEEEGLKTCACLKYIVCTGEPVSAELQERFFARLPAELSGYYGCTEAPSATVWHYQREDTRRLVTIGRPNTNKQIYLLNSELQPVPVGVPGEVYIGGKGLARGYLNRPGLTAEKFIPNPFRPEPGARLYRTGDRARYLSDGTLEFRGRLDQQVKIRGFRVELGEIEAVLSRHPVVRECVVLAREDGPGGKWLVAYVVVSREQGVTLSGLRSFLRERLPDYMVPAVFVLLDVLPLTPNGKVDRRALPAPEGGRSELERAFVAPCTPVEVELAEIWAEVLGLKRVGVHDNFFELGGDSLSATRVISRVRDALQVEVSLRGLFEQPTIAELAMLISQNEMRKQIRMILPTC